MLNYGEPLEDEAQRNSGQIGRFRIILAWPRRNDHHYNSPRFLLRLWDAVSSTDPKVISCS